MGTEPTELLLTLRRQSISKQSTVGELLIDGKHQCWTLEPPVLQPPAKPRAISSGTYDVGLRVSKRFKRELPFLADVPDFEGILIHSGNTAADTQGCILVGLEKGEDKVGSSRLALADLITILRKGFDGGGVAYLTVIDVQVDTQG